MLILVPLSHGHIFFQNFLNLNILCIFFIFTVDYPKKMNKIYLGHLPDRWGILVGNLKFQLCPGDMLLFANVNLGILCITSSQTYFFFYFVKTISLRFNMLASIQANLDYFIITFSLRLVPGTCFFQVDYRFSIHGIFFIVIVAQTKKMKYELCGPSFKPMLNYFDQPQVLYLSRGHVYIWKCSFGCLCIIPS